MRWSAEGAVRSGRQAVLLLLSSVTLAGCLDGRESVAPGTLPGAERPQSAALMSSCGVSYTATTVGEDTGLSAYGVPADTEVVNVCESWMGSDYQTQITIQSSNSGEFQSDGARIITYGNGYIDNYAADGSYQASANVGATAFDLVAATSAEVQASYDAPYYGVYGGGGGGGSTCIQIPCDEQFAVIGANVAEWRTRPNLPGFRHNVVRKGIRHVLNGYEERESPRATRRRFQKLDGDTDVILELDAMTELPVLEERKSAREHFVTKHVWRKRGDDFVRERTELVGEDRLPDGRVWKQRITITLTNVQWGRK
jgi:hypothetical protein